LPPKTRGAVGLNFASSRFFTSVGAEVFLFKNLFKTPRRKGRKEAPSGDLAPCWPQTCPGGKKRARGAAREALKFFFAGLGGKKKKKKNGERGGGDGDWFRRGFILVKYVFSGGGNGGSAPRSRPTVPSFRASFFLSFPFFSLLGKPNGKARAASFSKTFSTNWEARGKQKKKKKKKKKQKGGDISAPQGGNSPANLGPGAFYPGEF